MLTRGMLVLVTLAACGGGSSAPAKEPAIEQTAPPEAPHETAAASSGPRDYTFQPTGSAECDEMFARTMCAFAKAEDDTPDEAFQAFRDEISARTDALQKQATRQATIDACKMILDAGKDRYEAVGC